MTPLHKIRNVKSRQARTSAAKRSNVRPASKNDAGPGTGKRSDLSATRAVADALRREILRRGGKKDSYIGREDELVARFKVSKPTFRQAAKMLEHEQILVIKRGARGGFFAKLPTEKMVSHMAAMVLTTHGATLKQIAQAASALSVEGVRQLASHPNASVRAKVTEYLDAHAGFEKLADFRARARVIADFERLIAQLSGNPAIALFGEAIRALVREPAYAAFHVSEEQSAAIADAYQQMGQYIAQGDVEMAVLLAQRNSSRVTEWLPNIAPAYWTR